MNLFWKIIAILLTTLFLAKTEYLKCFDEDNREVPWFTSIKFPKNDGTYHHASYSSLDSTANRFTVFENYVGDEGEAIYRTLDQVKGIDGVELFA